MNYAGINEMRAEWKRCIGQTIRHKNMVKLKKYMG